MSTSSLKTANEFTRKSTRSDRFGSVTTELGARSYGKPLNAYSEKMVITPIIEV